MKKILVCLILMPAAFSLTFGQAKKKPVKTIIGSIEISSATVSQKLSPDSERRFKTFELVWTTIKNNYFDQTFSGLDWEKIRLEYEPQVLKTTTDEQLHGILSLMINRLNRSHLAIIPPDVYRELERAKINAGRKADSKTPVDGEEMPGEEDEEELIEDFESYKYGIGVDLRLINNQFVITRVAGGSAGEKAGLKLGFVIEKVNETSLKELLEKLQTWNQASQSVKNMLPLEIVAWFLNGDEDTSVALTYLDEKEQPKQIEIKREKLSGRMISIGGDFPAQFMNFETKSLSSEVGYVKFNLFALSTIEYFCASLTEFKDKKAIIIDLRGNVGGLIGSVIGVSGMLTEKPLDLGTQIYKVGTEKISVLPKAKNYKGKLVFLTDNLSISSAELLAAAMQENNRALVVGDKSAGAALPSMSILLPTGAVLLYPIANFKTPNGNYLEGIGVTPNFSVALDKKSLLEGRDNQLEKALNVIKEDTAFPKQIEKPKTITVVTDDSDEPLLAKPTPKPITALPPKVLGNVTVNAPKIKVETDKKVEKDEKDAKSVQLIGEFISAIGGEEALRKIETYQLSGFGELDIRGSKLEAEVSIYRQKPTKYAFIMKSESTGEFREIYNDKNFFLQSDFGISKDFAYVPDTAKVEIFAPIYSLLEKDIYKSLKYLGEFDRDGRKARLVEAKFSEYFSITLAFDAETKMLVAYASPLTTVFFGDYRKVENVSLPFEIIRDAKLKIFLSDIKLNPKIDESVFIKKENCFDRPN